MSLPTVDEMLAAAAREMRLAVAALDGAADWLRSDWRPVGSELTDRQVTDKERMFAAITVAKNAINEGKGRR